MNTSLLKTFTGTEETTRTEDPGIHRLQTRRAPLPLGISHPSRGSGPELALRMGDPIIVYVTVQPSRRPRSSLRRGCRALSALSGRGRGDRHEDAGLGDPGIPAQSLGNCSRMPPARHRPACPRRPHVVSIRAGGIRRCQAGLGDQKCPSLLTVPRDAHSRTVPTGRPTLESSPEIAGPAEGY